jgi:hypothetical protein
MRFSLVYAGMDGGGVFVSNNGGDAWSGMNTGLLKTSVPSLVLAPGAQ